MGTAPSQHISVADLSRRLGVSENSIRRDLTYLEDIGLLQRTHGGAQAVLRAGQNGARLTCVCCKRGG